MQNLFVLFEVFENIHKNINVLYHEFGVVITYILEGCRCLTSKSLILQL
jgi:hypothetical protein